MDTLLIAQNMVKYISRVHENHFNDPIKLIVHLLICFGSDFTLELGAESHLSLEPFVNQENRKQKKTAYLVNNPLQPLNPQNKIQSSQYSKENNGNSVR